MSLTQLAAVAVIVGTLVAVLTFIRGMKRLGQEQRTKNEEKRRELLAEGRSSRDNEVALLRSQRDDARRERDENGRRADTFETRYNDLRDRGT